MSTAKTEQQESTVVQIEGIQIATATLRLVGDSPLIVHAWSDKAKKMMLDKQMKKSTRGREAKDPFEDFCDSMYWLSPKPKHPTMEDVKTAKFGFPTVAFKASAVDGAFLAGVTAKKTTGRASFHIDGEMAEIISPNPPEMREDMVRVGMGTADIRYRGEFKDWSVLLNIRYNKNAMSLEQIVNLFNYGGFGVGVGEWRPAKDGSYGMFHVGNTADD